MIVGGSHVFIRASWRALCLLRGRGNRALVTEQSGKLTRLSLSRNKGFNNSACSCLVSWIERSLCSGHCVGSILGRILSHLHEDDIQLAKHNFYSVIIHIHPSITRKRSKRHNELA